MADSTQQCIAKYCLNLFSVLQMLQLSFRSSLCRFESDEEVKTQMLHDMERPCECDKVFAGARYFYNNTARLNVDGKTDRIGDSKANELLTSINLVITIRTKRKENISPNTEIRKKCLEENSNWKCLKFCFEVHVNRFGLKRQDHPNIFCACLALIWFCFKRKFFSLIFFFSRKKIIAGMLHLTM